MKARITRFLSKVEPDFKSILYGQCWEDADVLVEALPITNRSVCLSIVSAGDNTLALLAHGPKKVIAIASAIVTNHESSHYASMAQLRAAKALVASVDLGVGLAGLVAYERRSPQALGHVVHLPTHALE